MYCEKCGTKLLEDAAFCTNCGTSIKSTVKSQEKILDNEVQLNVKSTFSLGCMMFSDWSILLMFFIIILPMFILIPMIEYNTSIISMFLGILLVMVIMYLIWMGIRKIQYDNYSYDFYKTKVIYKDGFLNKTEKEVKYKYIREVVKRESFIQRFFNLGTIILYTNAESGYGNGIFILNIENVDDVYKKIKDIIDIDR